MERKVASRRRGEALEQAILDAAFEEFREAGYTGFTMEGVAKRAETSKPVVYRRWSSKVEILIACVSHRLPRAETVPDTGSLRGDIVALVTLAHERMRMVGQTAMLGMLADVSADPRNRELLITTLVSELINLLEEAVWKRAVERGELTWPHLTERLRRLPLDLVRNEFIIYGTVTSAMVESIVDEVVLPALRARGAAV